MNNKDRATVDIINIIQYNPKYCTEYLERMIYPNGLYQKLATKSLITAHKEVFDKQSYCWTGEFKFWVWDFDKWRVYVSDKKGICIEVNENIDIEEAMLILRTYWTKFEV